MEPVFSMDRDFKAQLSLWGTPLPTNLTQPWSTNSDMAQIWTISSIMGKTVLTITLLKWLVAMHIIFDRNIEEEQHLKSRDYLNQF